MMDNTIEKLTTLFTRFPGIGPRQAKRFVYFLLKNNQQNLNELAETIQSLKKNVVQCQTCFRHFTPNGNQHICKLCLDDSRDKNTLMILEKDSDLMAIEKADSYNGQFFIIGGLIPILDKLEPANRIRLAGLKKRISDNPPTEIIVALSANAEGDNTAEFLKKELKVLKEKLNFTLTVLGRGLSTGAELEYLDNDTFDNALKNRQQAN